MKKTTVITLLVLITATVGCSKLAQRGDTYQRIKVVRVIDKTSLEILYNGRLLVTDLGGIFLPKEETLDKTYFEGNQISSYYRDYVIGEFENGRMHLTELVASGDILFAENLLSPTGENQGIILYGPDMVSINEKMVRDGFAFPKRRSEITNARLADNLFYAFKESIRSKKGLWPLGKYILATYENESAETGSSPKPLNTYEPRPETTAAASASTAPTAQIQSESPQPKPSESSPTAKPAE
jgi:hypothetical protein